MTISDLRLTLRLTVEDYDAELQALADSALADLAMAGITSASTTLASLTDPAVSQAVKTYVRMNFGSPDDYDRLEKSYAIQKGQLMHATGHTDWGNGGDEA